MIELLIAVVLLMIVSAGMYRMLVRTQRASRAQSERIDMQSNMRAGALILPAELREVGYDDDVGGSTDILGIASDSIVFRAIRSSGIVCAVATNKIVVDTSRNYSASRTPVASRDTLMLFAETDAKKSTDDRWWRRPITNVKAGTCSVSFGSRPGIELTTAITSAGATDTFVIGSPMRTFETVVYKLYQSGGKNYLGMYSKSGNETVQPVLGPLAAGGLALKYYDSVYTQTTTLANIRSIQITLIGTTDQKITKGGADGTPAEAVDTLTTVVTLRNMLR